MVFGTLLKKQSQTPSLTADHSISSLPILVLMVHSQCDCRCVMCDIWKVRQEREISEAQLRPHLSAFVELGVRWVIFSGGEPLMHSHLFTLSDCLRKEGIRVTLLSTGQRMERFSREIATRTDDTILSLDGPEAIHDAIRRVQGGFSRLKEGILAVRKADSNYPISARTTVQLLNFRFLRDTVETAKALQLNSISFLAADVTSQAFNRPVPWDDAKKRRVTISREQICELEEELEKLIQHYSSDIASGFIRESTEKIRHLAHYFRVQAGVEEPQSPRCNAPWVSAVVGPEGSLRPCFFHAPLGNLYQQDLTRILNGPEALQFRSTLDVSRNPICQRCVCSLYLPMKTDSSSFEKSAPEVPIHSFHMK